MAERAVSVPNGPDADLHGRDPRGLHGAESFPALRGRCGRPAARLAVRLAFRESDHEGVPIDWIQEARGETAGLLDARVPLKRARGSKVTANAAGHRG